MQLVYLVVKTLKQKNAFWLTALLFSPVTVVYSIECRGCAERGVCLRVLLLQMEMLSVKLQAGHTLPDL